MGRLSLISRSFALFCLTLGLIAQSTRVEAETPQQLAKKSFQSVVLLVTGDAAGQPVSLGSGFFVREGVVASNLREGAGNH
jgi:hypothetical protein